MTRRTRTTLQRAAIFERDKGICHICGQKIDGTKDAWEMEHKVPYALTRDDSDENLGPAHLNCHKRKTQTDKGQIAKAKRVHAKFIGAHEPKSIIPGSRKSKWKRKLRGKTVPRK